LLGGALPSLCVIARRRYDDEAISIKSGKMQRGGIVYILTNAHNEVLYTGVTSNLVKRLNEHKQKKYETSFTAKYNICKLVYYGSYTTIEEAIAEEKRIKGGSRAKKIKLIESMNHDWRDLSEEVFKW
jgi:putative endonuclease